MDRIKKIKAREILSVMALPTLEVEIETENNIKARAAVDIGTSIGKYEAVTLFDGGNRLFGQGNKKAVQIINENIAPQLIGINVTDQKLIDERLIEMDGTPDKSHLGGNSMLGVSMAAAKAGALSLDIPLYHHLSSKENQDISIPAPVFVMIHGGIGFSNLLQLEDFCLIPVDFDSFSEALESGIEIYYKLYDLLKEKHLVAPGITFVPQMSKTREALDCMLQATRLCGYEDRYKLGLDAAATECFDESKNIYQIDQIEIPKEEIISYYREILENYPFLYLEDPFHEDDLDNYQQLSKTFDNMQIVGDDMIASNKTRLQKAADMKLINSVLLKPNQIGTISELLEIAKLAKKLNIDMISSIRSKSTNELFLADFSIAIGATEIKAGCVPGYPSTGIYNRFLQIEEKNKTQYMGSVLKQKYN